MRRKRLEYGYGGSLVSNAPFKMHALDLLKAESLLSLEAFGALVRLLLAQHYNCGWLDDDDAGTARCLHVSLRRWQRLKAELRWFITPGELPGRITAHMTPQYPALVGGRDA